MQKPCVRSQTADTGRAQLSSDHRLQHPLGRGSSGCDAPGTQRVFIEPLEAASLAASAAATKVEPRVQEIIPRRSRPRAP
jgi:hypothetical protein